MSSYEKRIIERRCRKLEVWSRRETKAARHLSLLCVGCRSDLESAPIVLASSSIAMPPSKEMEDRPLTGINHCPLSLEGIGLAHCSSSLIARMQIQMGMCSERARKFLADWSFQRYLPYPTDAGRQVSLGSIDA
jgi:hypothetical protein